MELLLVAALSNRDPCGHQFAGGPGRGRQPRGVELGERALGFVDAPDQQQAPDLEIPRVRGVRPVGVRFERRPRRGDRPPPARAAVVISESIGIPSYL